MPEEEQQSGGEGSEQEADDPGEFELVEIRKGENPPDRKGLAGMPEEEQGGGQSGGQGGDQDGGAGGSNESGDPGQFDLGWEIRRRDPGGLQRGAGDGAPPTRDETAPEPGDPGEFELIDLTEEERPERAR